MLGVRRNVRLFPIKFYKYSASAKPSQAKTAHNLPSADSEVPPSFFGNHHLWLKNLANERVAKSRKIDIESHISLYIPPKNHP